MRFFLFSLATISLLLLPACNLRSSTSETDITPVAPAPIAGAPPVAAADPVIERAESTVVSPPSQPEFRLDPAPAPPTEKLPEESAAEPTSVEGIFDSIARVLQGAVEAGDDETNSASKGSVVGSIARALSEGFREAAVREPAQEE